MKNKKEGEEKKKILEYLLQYKYCFITKNIL